MKLKRIIDGALVRGREWEWGECTTDPNDMDLNGCRGIVIACSMGAVAMLVGTVAALVLL